MHAEAVATSAMLGRVGRDILPRAVRMSRPRISRRVASALALAALIALPAAASAASVSTSAPAADALAPRGEAARLHALFDESWAHVKREFPEFATFLGDDRYNDRLTDLSPAAIERRKAYRKDLLARLSLIDPRRLSGQDAVSYAVMKSSLERRIRVDAYPDDRMPVSPMGGPQLEFALLAKSTPFRAARDYERYLARLGALPVHLRQIEALMRQGLASGWALPTEALGRVPAQIDAWLTDDVAKSPAWAPFTQFPRDMSEAERTRLADAGRRVIVDDVVPAFRALKAFMVSTYVPGARKSLGASTLPGGDAYYDAVIADRTTTAMTAREIHELGLREVERIGPEMDAAIRRTGFGGTRAEFFQFLHDAPQFYYTRGENMLAGYRDLAKRVDAQLPKLFAELPRLPYGIRAMDAFEGDNAEHYTPGSPEGGRAGFFEANVNHLRTRPIYDMETVFLHEAVPGHHLQIARAQELRGLPEFRRHGGFVAYSEGWALYAESLGDELGLYTDPYSRFGRLTWEMVRACRLVIDTGIHAQGWDRAGAIAYLTSNSGINQAFATAEVDRYIVNPGQALGYKLGELKIKSLRAKASAALGERFDIRRFHNALIDDGALPLDVLDARIDAWIARELKQVQASAAPTPPARADGAR
jgi:uncharacterized protein (DUF885 family)